jgi:bifunctional DNase/RNase
MARAEPLGENQREPMPTDSQRMIEVTLGRIILREDSDQQWIVLHERGGERSFPIVIGNAEAMEIQRVVEGQKTVRPLTHALLHAAIKALGATLKRVDIVDLRQNTFFAQLVLEGAHDQSLVVVDARPSDAVALALRARCPIRASEAVIRQAVAQGTDPSPSPEPPEDEDES